MAAVEAGEVTALFGEVFALQYFANTLPCTTEVRALNALQKTCWWLLAVMLVIMLALPV